MLKFRVVVFFFIAGLLFTACGSDRAGNTNKSAGVLGVVDSDSDGDGVSDNDEVNIYGTNPDSNDTDGDGLLDGDEINFYDTNATNVDTDGDCLLDSFEVLYYETNASNVDTDGDGRADGIEIYSYVFGETNSTCLNTPETIEGGHNANPAMDNTPNDGTDVINALDSNLPVERDSDGDGVSDSDEVNIYGTNPDSNDTDGDGLLDGDEINFYDTNATNADTDGDGLNDGVEVHTYETNATNPDSDGDLLLDGAEINIHGTNPLNRDSDDDNLTDALEINTYSTDANDADSDNDGLLDGSEVLEYGTNPLAVDSDDDNLSDELEINNYDTNATNPDTDNDGLNDGLEINLYETNATNPDTDGDCLLDSFEVLHYETNASNVDTDGDTVADGIEIYSYVANDFNIDCLLTPESLEEGHNPNPAKDGIPNVATDIINALDPTNDSDGDEQSNIFENNCTEGNASNATKLCPFLTDTRKGSSLVSSGFTYIPGGFDVDGDGINETGFWTSSYQARAKAGERIEAGEVNSKLGNFNSYIQKKFFMINATNIISPIIHGYNDESLSDTLVNEPIPIGIVLEFSLNLNPKIKKRVSGIMPFMSMFSLSEYKVYDSEHNDLGLDLTMLSLKQYAHIEQLLQADKDNGGTGHSIRNGLLGIDVNVPLFTYSKLIHEFGEGYKEYLSSIMQMKEGSVILCSGCPWVRDWMGINKKRLVKNPNELAADLSLIAKGASSNINVGMGVGVKVDDYGVLVRAGEVLDLTVGVAGATSDQTGTHDGIGFRAATAYDQ